MPAPDPLEFSLTEAERDGEHHITLGGDLDVVAAAQLAEAMRRGLGEERRLVVDLGDVVFMDSSGLAVILKTPGPAERERVTLVCSRHAQPRRLLEMAGVLALFDVR